MTRLPLSALTLRHIADLTDAVLDANAELDCDLQFSLTLTTPDGDVIGHVDSAFGSCFVFRDRL